MVGKVICIFQAKFVLLSSKQNYMIIQRHLPYKGKLGTASLHTLFDSGATVSCIHPDKAKDISIPVELAKPIMVGTAAEGTFLYIKEYVHLFFELEGHELMDIFVIVPNLNAEVVIGVDTLQKYHCKLDFKEGTISVEPSAGKLMLM
jgi:predicted aspartyl protease